MPRPLLAEEQLHPAIRDKVATLHADLVGEVQQACTARPGAGVGAYQVFVCPPAAIDFHH